MIHLITSKDNHICYLTLLLNNMTNPITIRYWFQVHSLVNPIDESEYETNTNKFLYNYYCENDLSDCIKNISSSIINRHAEMLDRPEDKQEEEIIISACEKHINSEVVQYLESYTINYNLTVESIYQLMMITSYEDIIITTKRILGIDNTNILDENNLIAVTYALYKVLDRGK